MFKVSLNRCWDFFSYACQNFYRESLLEGEIGNWTPLGISRKKIYLQLQMSHEEIVERWRNDSAIFSRWVNISALMFLGVLPIFRWTIIDLGSLRMDCHVVMSNEKLIEYPWWRFSTWNHNQLINWLGWCVVTYPICETIVARFHCRPSATKSQYDLIVAWCLLIGCPQFLGNLLRP